MLAKFIAMGALPIFLFGCASTPTQPMANSDKSNVKAVTLSKNVPVPTAMSYLGPGGSTGLAFGAIGGALAVPGIEKERASFQEQAVLSGKSIDAIVYEEALTQIRQSGKFPLRDAPEPGSATIYVSVLNYGFSIPNGFSSKLVPILEVRYELRDASGRVLWSAADRTMPLGNPVEAIDADEIKKMLQRERLRGEVQPRHWRLSWWQPTNTHAATARSLDTEAQLQAAASSRMLRSGQLRR